MLRLGTQTGSLCNHLFSRAVIGEPSPEIGMGATILGWTDREPATIVSVFTKGKTLHVGIKRDNYKRTDTNGFSESQSYEYSFNPEMGIEYFRKGKDGTWESIYTNPETGRTKKGYGSLRIGQRDKYWDPCF